MPSFHSPLHILRTTSDRGVRSVSDGPGGRRARLTAGAAVLAVLALVTGCGSGATSGQKDAVSDPSDAAAEAASRAPAAPQVTAAVNAFFESYLKDPSSTENQRFLTPELSATVYAGKGRPELVFCSRKAPDSVTVSEPEVSGETLTVKVTAHTSGSPDRKITVAVLVPDILVSAITCPGS
jgi:hypothetical protein